MTEAPADDDPVLFQAVLTPHRSLPPRGFWLLIGLFALVCLAVGAGFALIGAWPVFGFIGLEIVLVAVAFRASYRSGRLFEALRLTARLLTVRRVQPGGREKRWRFQPYWLRVTMDDPPRHDSQLRLTSHGRSLSIAAFLTPEERLDLARALQAALARVRPPV